MIVEYCDICGKPLSNEPYSRYKLKKEWGSWYEHGWERIAIHESCWGKMCNLIKDTKEEGVQNNELTDTSQISDGYHTFADLYEQRLILSAALAKNNPNAWKSKLHEDGTEPFGGGWFIMGWTTPEGDYTYHYELKDWDLFECEELPTGKHWDGHTSADIRRLLSIM